MGILLSKEIEDLAHDLFHIHHTKNLKWNNCSQDLRQWYLLEADHIIRDLGYSKSHTPVSVNGNDPHKDGECYLCHKQTNSLGQ